MAVNKAMTIWLNEEKSNIPYSKLENSYNKIQAVNLEQKSQYILIVICRKKYLTNMKMDWKNIHAEKVGVEAIPFFVSFLLFS